MGSVLGCADRDGLATFDGGPGGGFAGAVRLGGGGRLCCCDEAGAG